METNKGDEEFKISGEEVLKKVKEIIKEGSARKIIIKNEKGLESCATNEHLCT